MPTGHPDGLTTLIELRSKIVSKPQVVACVVSPVQGDAGTGVPARYIVELFTSATLPAGMLTATPGVGGVVVLVRADQAEDARQTIEAYRSSPTTDADEAVSEEPA